MRIPVSFFIVSCSLLPLSSFAQVSTKDSSIRAMAVYNAVQQYQRTVTVESPLYNGQEYIEYESQLHTGHPFFEERDFHPASIMYDNILYENIPFKYDLIKKKLVIRSPVGGFSINILDNKVSSFEVQGHQFVRLTKDSSGRKALTTGFYDLLYNGRKTQLLKKESKKILEELTIMDGIKRTVTDDAAYYLQKGGTYSTINSKKQALELLKDRKTELKQYIRKNKLKFRANKENDLVKLVTYYDTTWN